MLRHLLLTTTILGGLAMAQAHAANLVSNGSFESGLTGWTAGGTDTDSPLRPVAAIFYNSNAGYPTGAFGEPVPPQNDFTNSPDAVGTRAAYFVSDFAGPQSLSQTITITTAGIYQIGFSAYLPLNGQNNRGEATFVGKIAGVTLANFVASGLPAQTWKTYGGSTNLTPGDYLVEFVFNTNFRPSKDVVIDQVYVIAGNPPIDVPEPATLALLGAGLLGLGIARRARRRDA